MSPCKCLVRCEWHDVFLITVGRVSKIRPLGHPRKVAHRMRQVDFSRVSAKVAEELVHFHFIQLVQWSVEFRQQWRSWMRLVHVLERLEFIIINYAPCIVIDVRRRGRHVR